MPGVEYLQLHLTISFTLIHILLETDLSDFQTSYLTKLTICISYSLDSLTEFQVGRAGNAPILQQGGPSLSPQ